MANAIQQSYKQNLLAGTSGYDLDNDTSTDGPFVSLIDTGTYTYNAAHDFFNDVTGTQGTDQRITAPTVTNGTLDGGDLTYTAVSGNSIEALVIYRHNAGANSTWPYVAFIDSSVTGLPLTPNGGNITVTWNASGIFTISDARLKRDIREIGQLTLQLKVYEFRYEGQETLQRGLIAQEVLQTLPEAIIGEDLMAIDYGLVGAWLLGDWRH